MPWESRSSRDHNDDEDHTVDEDAAVSVAEGRVGGLGGLLGLGPCPGVLRRKTR